MARFKRSTHSFNSSQITSPTSILNTSSRLESPLFPKQVENTICWQHLLTYINITVIITTISGTGAVRERTVLYNGHLFTTDSISLPKRSHFVFWNRMWNERNSYTFTQNRQIFEETFWSKFKTKVFIADLAELAMLFSVPFSGLF